MLRSLAALLVTVSVLGACSGSESNRDPVEETTGRPACSVPAAELRRPISADNPLFVFNIYGGPEEVFAVDTVLPDDVRPYFAIQYVPPEPYDHGEEFRARVESVLDAAEQLDFPLFIQTEHCYTRSETPPSDWSELFRRYTSLVGLVWSEISCTGLQLIGLDDDYIRRMKDTIETVAAHGAYFLWQDMGWDRPGPWESTPHVFVKAGSDEALYRTITGNAADDDGGGICCYYSDPTITNNTISDNTSYSCGGGIHCQWFSSPTIENNTISGNIAEWGGGIYCNDSSPTIINNTITGNTV